MISALLRIKHNTPWLWQCIEAVNGKLTHLRYPRVKETAAGILRDYGTDSYSFSLVEDADIEKLSTFFVEQTDDSLEHFKPHAFDIKTLRRLHRNGGYLMMKITQGDSNEVVGYFFLRYFFNGKAFHGLIVSPKHRGRGLGSMMWKAGTLICRQSKLEMFATVSTHNTPSIESARKGCRVEIMQKLPDDYLLIKCGVK